MHNHVPTRLDERYDASVHVEETEALHLLEEPGAEPATPETYSGVP